MAWIETHQELERHPKTLDLMASMKWDLDTTIGRLLRFWWWCMDYAEDGDLRKHSPQRLANALGIEDGERFIGAMIDAGFIDREPYLRIHDWWDYVGEFLRGKYKRNHPEKWQRIRTMYDKNSIVSGDMSGTMSSDIPCQPNLTKPNLTEQEEHTSPEGDPPPPEIVQSSGNGLDYQRFVELYHQHCPSLPRIRELSDSRKAMIRARWAKHAEWEFWEQHWQRVEASDFLSGRGGRGAGHENWMPTLDWLMKHDHFNSTVEGAYDNRTVTTKADQRTARNLAVIRGVLQDG